LAAKVATPATVALVRRRGTSPTVTARAGGVSRAALRWPQTYYDAAVVLQQIPVAGRGPARRSSSRGA